MSNRKLLLADDSVTIQKVINLTFADEGIDVVTVGDGDTAIERFNDFRPDIVLADVNMPGLNGYQICEKLRQAEDSSHVPVILLVGSFEPFDEDEARRVGANDWITKPFQSIRQLVAKVSGLREGAGTVETAVEEPVAAELDHDELPAFERVNVRTGENEDIDSLYQQSIAETVELPRSFRPDPVLGDTGMDDDMIEMSYSGTPERADATDFELVSSAESVAFESAPVSDAEPIREATTSEDTMYPVGNLPFQNMDDTLPVMNFRPVEVDIWPEDRIAREQAEQQAAQDVVSDTAEDNGVGLSIENRAENNVALDTTPLSFETRPEIGDTNLLELPSTNPTQSPVYRSDEDVIGLDAASPVDNLSPEFIEAVARKVIEKISENVIRQIAWQVVPQVADSVLRDKTREESEQ